MAYPKDDVSQVDLMISKLDYKQSTLSGSDNIREERGLWQRGDCLHSSTKEALERLYCTEEQA